MMKLIQNSTFWEKTGKIQQMFGVAYSVFCGLRTATAGIKASDSWGQTLTLISEDVDKFWNVGEENWTFDCDAVQIVLLFTATKLDSHVGKSFQDCFDFFEE